MLSTNKLFNILFNAINNIIKIVTKNGIYIHFIYFLLYHMTQNVYLSAAITFKLYSINYFYWFGHIYTYLPNPRNNWIKQFIRFTDTGHIASFIVLFYPRLLPIAHNIHFIIMSGYWIGKFGFNLQDADKIVCNKSNPDTSDIIDTHTDICTYMHHTIPYMLVLAQMHDSERSCLVEYNNANLLYTYYWLYTWAICIYIPWRLITNDAVYSILDQTQTPSLLMILFIGFIHILVYLSNIIGYGICVIL